MPKPAATPPAAKKRPKKKPTGRKAPPRHEGPGRPTKLTAELIDQAATLAVSLATDAALCAVLKVTPKTWCEWKNEAAAGSAKHQKLFDAIEEQRALEEVALVAKIKDDPDWRAKKWLLETRRKGYLAKQLHELTGKDGAPLAPSSPVAPITIIMQGGPLADNPYLPG